MMAFMSEFYQTNQYQLHFYFNCVDIRYSKAEDAERDVSTLL